MKRPVSWLVLMLAVLVASCACSPQEPVKVSATVPAPAPAASAPPMPAPAPRPPPSAIYAPEEVSRPAAPTSSNRASMSRPPSYSTAPSAGRVRPIGPISPASDAMRTWPFFDQLTKADIAFNAPEKMEMGKDAEMQLIIDPTKTAEEIKAAITAEGAKVGATVQVSKIVVAKLLAPDFEVVEFVNKGRQAIDFNGPTEWKWLITPKEEGAHKIHLTISAVIEIGTDRAERLIKTFDRQITVIVTPTDRIKGLVEKHWQWAFSSLLVPLAIWLWRRYRGKLSVTT